MTMEERISELAAHLRNGLAEALNLTIGEANELDTERTARIIIQGLFPELTGPNPTHVIVPVEPNEKMELAGWLAFPRIDEDGPLPSDTMAIYKAMLAAAD